MRTLRAAVLTLCVLSLVSLGAGPEQIVKSHPPVLIRRGPVISGDDGNPIAGVHLSRTNIKAVVHGTLAQATMTLTFANNQPRVLGGNLTFPLPQGATVTGYGLDINGQMVDGVAVEKERARIIYESELHKRVDPGLVEQVEGNTFRTRLYPIPPNGTRSVKIEYVTQVGQGPDGATLTLPMALGDGLDTLSIRVEAPEATATPSIKTGGIDGLDFRLGDRGFIANATAPTPKVADELVIALPQIPAKSVAVEKRQKMVRTVEELKIAERADIALQYENYFLVSDTPAIGAARHAATLKNHRIAVVWDASMSRASGDHARELKLLEASLHRLGDPAVDLIELRNDIHVHPDFPAGPEGIAKLIGALKAIIYDGATNFGALIMPKNVEGLGVPRDHLAPDYDFYLLFSDGFGNLGPERPLRAEVPVFALCDDVRANHAMLRSICQESGGTFYNLTQATDDQVLAGIGNAPFGLVSIEYKLDEITELYPPAGTPINGRLSLSGKLLVPEARLTLHYGYGKQVTGSETFTISSLGAAEGSLIPRFWAQQKSAALSLAPEKNAGEITEIGKQFNLVTPNTSLLVLETAEQYAQYEVVPPASRVEVYKQFLAMLDRRHVEQAQTREQKLQQVAALWETRVKWWEAEYKYPANLTVGNDVATGDPRGRNLGGATTQPVGLIDAPELALNSTANRPAAARTSLSAARPISGRTEVREEEMAGLRRDQVQSTARFRAEDLNSDGAAVAQVPGSIAASASKREKDAMDVNGDFSIIQIKTWDPKTPYIAAMKAVGPNQAYGVYLQQRKDNATSPAFYFDCADYFLSINQRELGIRVLTDIVELELHDSRLLRVAAHRLNQIGQRELAIDLFEKILKLRPEEPQSYRDLALALADRADAAVEEAYSDGFGRKMFHPDRAVTDYSRAMDLLNKVVEGNWPRFPEVEMPVLMEANEIAFKAQHMPGIHDFHNPLDARLQRNLDLDVRVVMTWDADQTDIDLWVTEPSGEKCLYSHNRTVIGGLLSHDFTDGYGPEEYCLRKNMPGKYTIQANFYGSRQQELTGPATVQATVITNFGRPNEKRQSMTLRLKDAKEVVDVGMVEIGK